MKPDNKVIVRLKGGVGNQLFEYAAARRLALKNEASLVIDSVTGFARDIQYRREYALDRFQIGGRLATPAERLEPFERWRRALVKLRARRRPFVARKYVEQERLDFDPRLLEYRVAGTVYLDGYWQSEGYFKDVSAEIRKDLEIKAPQDATNQELAKRIRGCESVGIHVRWFDKTLPALNIPTANNLTRDYYINAIQNLKDKLTDPHFFLFSDDLAAAREALALPEEQVTSIGHNRGDENAYADLWLMTQCRHFIIANSTFSWWGAWLARFEPKIIIAPNLKLVGVSNWGFAGLIPEGWVLV